MDRADAVEWLDVALKLYIDGFNNGSHEHTAKLCDEARAACAALGVSADELFHVSNFDQAYGHGALGDPA